MYKKLAFLLVVVSLILAACAPAAPTEAPKKVWTYKDMTVGFLQTGSEGGWRAANSQSFKETATQLGINLKFYDSQNELAKPIGDSREGQDVADLALGVAQRRAHLLGYNRQVVADKIEHRVADEGGLQYPPAIARVKARHLLIGAAADMWSGPEQRRKRGHVEWTRAVPGRWLRQCRRVRC